MESIFEKLGGRKMALTLIVIVVGAAVDILAANGLSANLAGLLVGATAVFGAANTAVSMAGMKATSAAVVAVAEETAPPQEGGASELQELRAGTINAVEELSNRSKIIEDRLAANDQALETATKLIKAMIQIKTPQQ